MRKVKVSEVVWDKLDELTDYNDGVRWVIGAPYSKVGCLHTRFSTVV